MTQKITLTIEDGDVIPACLQLYAHVGTNLTPTPEQALEAVRAHYQSNLDWTVLSQRRADVEASVAAKVAADSGIGAAQARNDVSGAALDAARAALIPAPIEEPAGDPAQP